MCANLHLCAECNRGLLALKGRGLLNQRKGSCDVIQKPLEFKYPQLLLCAIVVSSPSTLPTECIQKLCYAKSSVLWDSGQELWVKAAIETSSGIQPTLWSHAQWDDTANRKAHSAALFQAPTQQPQRGPDRPICQTQLWRNPVSCNISESRHQLTDSFLPNHIRKGSTLTHRYQDRLLASIEKKQWWYLIKQQFQEVTFSFSMWNPLLSYCAGSSALGTSGNVFLLNGGGNSGQRHREKKAKGCKNKQLF